MSNKQSISAGDASINMIAGGDISIVHTSNIPPEFADEKIEEYVARIRKSRYFSEFNTKDECLLLGQRLVNGNLSGGSNSVRGRALAWCARLLARSEVPQAEEFLEHAKRLGSFTETKISEAFIVSQKGDKAAALGALSGIDSDASRTAALMIVAHHDNSEGAITWMNTAGYKIEAFNSDGKSFLLNHYLQLGRWSEVAQIVSEISNTDCNDTPILHHFLALAKLAPAIPQEYRAIVLTQVPFDARQFPLASNAAGLEARLAAHKHFLDAVVAADKLGCPRAAKADDEYAIWLELRDPAQSEHGKRRLESKLRDPNTSLGYVHHALQYGIKLDLDKVRQDIEQTIAINGGINIDATLARFALAFTQPTADEAANYIARYYDQLATHIDTKLIRYRQIEMLSKSGLIKKANEVLEQLLGEGIPPEHENELRVVISRAQGSDPIESRIIQYEASGSLSELINLVAELEENRRWDDLCNFGRRLFEMTHALSDAERLVKAFDNLRRSREVVLFLKENADLLPQSKHLCMLYAWSLYYEGDFISARAALANISDEVDDPNHRALQVNLGIATGDWASLSAYIADEFRNRDKRSAHDLINVAKLALHLNSPQTKDIVFAAAAKTDADSNVLANAYFIATNAGWEDDPRVFQWFERAVELSGDDGPIKRMSLKDILDQKPKWDRHESETWRLLAQGQAPIFLAAQSLNKTLIDLTTVPALANLSEPDPRRKNAIPAYSGKRISSKLDVNIKTVALDATVLLTLSFLEILDVALDAFETILIPHATLLWLFQERRKAVFHQPSQIENARKIQNYLATGSLENFTPTTVASSNLSAQIGDDLAALIAEAEKFIEDGGLQRIVVRSAPVHRLSSLMEEEADLSAHAEVLSSCLAIVEKLRQKGRITADQEKRARAYLQFHEKPWLNQPNITDGAILYLDDLTVTYFLHLGLIEGLKAAGFRAVASPREVSEANALISYEHISGKVQDAIERIQTALNSRIESGRVRIGPVCKSNREDEKFISEHPTANILSLAPHCDIFIVDDRFINQYAHIDSDGVQAPIFSSLELIDALVDYGALSDCNRLECRTRLRRAGYFFVPVDVNELETCLREADIVSGEVVETAELKAIRESILRVRMSDWLQLPNEAPWLDGMLRAIVHVLRNLWVDGANIQDVIARSDWLAELYDVRGWAHRLAPETAYTIAKEGSVAHILLLLMPITGVQQGISDIYWKWVEEKILASIQEQFPEVYELLVAQYRKHIAELTEIQHLEGIVHDEPAL